MKKLPHEKQKKPGNKREDEPQQRGRETPTWKDPTTGLEWQRESPGAMSWYQAREYAKALSLDGRNDWRVPTAAELETLLDRRTLFQKLRPDMREEVPFRDDLSYWSSTTFADNTKNAWIVMFDGAYILSYYKSNSYYVRCVRGEANHAFLFSDSKSRVPEAIAKRIEKH